MRYALLLCLALVGCSQKPGHQILAFTADWCPACVRDHGLVPKTAVTVNIDRQPDMAERYCVESVPTYIVVDHGREVLRTHDVGRLNVTEQAYGSFPARPGPMR